MWIVTESPDFARRALGERLTRRLSPLPLEQSELPQSLRVLVDELVPGRTLFGCSYDEGDFGLKGHLLVLLAPVRSQFDVAIELVRGGGGLPVFLIAGAGTAFRGHHGRSWSACLGNLHLSAIFLPERSEERVSAALVALPCVAVCDVLADVAASGDFGIKWVNDVMIDGAKVAGVLAHTSCRGGRVAALVYGVGINVEVTPRIAEDPVVPSATSLSERNPELQLKDLSLRLMLALQSRIEQWSREGGAPIVDAYRRASIIEGRDVEIIGDPRPEHESESSLSAKVLRRGRVQRLDESLQVYLDDAESEPVRDGRLRLLP